MTEGEVASEDARVEIRRPGIVEWYENFPAGLEQGFTLAERPDGRGELVLELAVAGATASLRRDEVLLATAAACRLAYGKLLTVDVSGRSLPSHFEVASADRVRLAVNDASAAYPIVIDPLLSATSDTHMWSAEESFGSSLAAADVNGDGYSDVVVGAPGSCGKASKERPSYGSEVRLAWENAPVRKQTSASRWERPSLRAPAYPPPAMWTGTASVK